MFSKHARYVALAGLLLITVSQADEEACKRATAKVFQSRPSTAEWNTAVRPVPEAKELARLRASLDLNVVSMTVERLSDGRNFRIVSSPEPPAIQAYSQAGVVDYIRQFQSQAADGQSLMIYLQGFPQEESLSLRQTLRIHLDRESAFFLETGKNVDASGWQQLLKQRPLMDSTIVSGAMAQPYEMVLSIALPLDRTGKQTNLRATIKASGQWDRLTQFLTRLIDRVKAVLRDLAPGANVHDTARAVQVALDREFELIEKETGLKKKDLTIRLAVEGSDIYFSLSDDPLISAQHLAVNAGTDRCSTS